jgi:3-aminobutyryl-CoA ammonia-lyase
LTQPERDPIEASHRLRLGISDAHYGGGLVSGAKLIELIHDVATELCIRSDGDEGLFAGYSSVEFLAPVHAGDLVEVIGRIVRFGRTSREMEFRVVRYAGPRPDVSESAADLIDPAEIVARATGTCVVTLERQRNPVRDPNRVEGSGS